MTEDEVRTLLKTKTVPTQTAFAKEHDISIAYVNDVIRGRKEPGIKILNALGLEKLPAVYRKKAR